MATKKTETKKTETKKTEKKTLWRTDVPKLGEQIIITVEANGKRKTKVSAYLGNGMYAGQMSMERMIAWQPMPEAYNG